MPDVPSSSFIPKRTEGTKIRQKRTRNFFLLSIISYACLIAAPTASAAVYVYQLYTNRQFEQVVTSLDAAMSSFSEAEMARVLEFDRRLTMAKSLIENHVSIVKVLESLEQTTATEAGFTTLAIKRNGDGSLEAVADIVATNFDTALFQRSAYKSENVPIADATLSSITFVPPSDLGEGERVTMTGTFDFAVSDIRFTAVENAPTEASTDTTETPAEDVDGNDDSSDLEDGAAMSDVTEETL